MNTKKEIISFLEQLLIGVQGKRDSQDKHINEVKKSGEHDRCDYLNILKISREHTEGQLYEINYIIENLKRDKRKKDY